MLILRRLLVTGLVAGVAAGVLVSLAQQVRVIPLILAAEIYERREAGGSAEAAPQQELSRLALTVAANTLTGIGFALLLAAAYALHGRESSLKGGLLWGLAGYGVFVLSPAIGLPPELPGAPAVAVQARQLWWAGAAAAAAGGLAMGVFNQRLWVNALGGAVIVLPHMLGAPHPPEGTIGTVPDELAQQFIAASLLTSALFWLFLGGFSGWLYRRLAPAAH